MPDHTITFATQIGLVKANIVEEDPRHGVERGVETLGLQAELVQQPSALVGLCALHHRLWCGGAHAELLHALHRLGKWVGLLGLHQTGDQRQQLLNIWDLK